MAYPFAYQLKFKNVEDVDVTANIYDTLSGEGTTVFTQLEGAADPLHIFVVDNDEAKFSSIKALQAEIKFHSTDTVNLSSFIGTGEDNRWYVEILIDTDIKFKGFLVLDDMDQDFLDNNLPNVVTLIATDNIGLLKDEPLTLPESTVQYTADIDTGINFGISSIHLDTTGLDTSLFHGGVAITIDNASGANGTYSITQVLIAGSDMIIVVSEPIVTGVFTGATIRLKIPGVNPRGYFNIITYIALALRKTGLELPINVVHNVKEEHDATNIIYSSLYLFSKTFEAAINESIDCYRVIESIIGEDCYLTQANGEWWIIRVDDLDDNATIVTAFDSEGEFVQEAPFDLVTLIGPNETIYFTGLSTFVKTQQPVKKSSLTYNYEYPKEVIDNIDFSRSVAFVENDFGTTKEYRLDDWQLRKNNDVAIGTDGRAFVRRVYENNYEKERSAVIHSNVFNQKFIKSNRIPVHVKDRFDISVDSKYSTDIGGGFYRHATMQVVLYAEGGNFWSLHGGSSAEPDPYWSLGTTFVSNSNPPSGNRYIVTEGNLNADNLTDWKTVYKTKDYPPLPDNGELEIRLMYDVNIGNEKSFSNLRFTYIPYIDGSYSEVVGQTLSVYQTLSTKKVYDEEVMISDSPKKLFKGALFYNDGTHFKLAGLTYDGRQFPTTPPSSDQQKLFSRNQTEAVWNQNNRTFRIFDLTAQGLNTSAVYPSLIHKYKVNEVSDHTTDKYFMMLHFDHDLKLCEWKGVMIEVFDENIAKDYSSPFEFKYITRK